MGSDIGSFGGLRCGLLNPLMLRRFLPERGSSWGLLIGAATVALIGAGGIAHAGPCTTQIAQLQQQISLAASSPDIGPTAPQTVGAQLHHQPTPGAVEHGEIIANADADAALDRARKADANGQADACDQALREARRLYGID
jgi:hypothetical protein